MPTLTISEFPSQASNERGGLAPLVALASAVSHTVAIGASSAQSVTLGATTTVVRVATDTDCRIVAGANPAALATSLLLTAGQSESFSVAAGSALKIAVIVA